MNDPRHERLLRFLEGSLDQDERARVLEEVEADPELAAELRSAARGMAAMERLAAAPLPSPGEEAAGRGAPRRVSPWWAVAAAAAAVLVAVPTTLRLAGPATPPPTGAAAIPEQEEPSFVLVLQGVWPDAATVAPEERVRRAGEYWSWAARLAEEELLLAAGDLRWEPGRRLGARGAALPGADPDNPDFVVGMYAVRVGSYEEAEALARDCPHLRYGGSVAVRRVAAGFVTTAGLADWEE